MPPELDDTLAKRPASAGGTGDWKPELGVFNVLRAPAALPLRAASNFKPNPVGSLGPE